MAHPAGGRPPAKYRTFKHTGQRQSAAHSSALGGNQTVAQLLKQNPTVYYHAYRK
jgi:hypothetical protein